MNNMSQIMKQAKAMQDKMAEMQKKIEEQEVEGSSGGGVIKVLVNGKNEIKSFNLKFLSEETRNFIPEISGNFIKDKNFFSNFWNCSN